LANCAAPPPVVQPPAPPRVLQVASEALEQQFLLDIGLAVFDPGIPESRLEQDQMQINPGVRQAEAQYFPYLLRKTLELSGQWGAVRVLPQVDPTIELLIEGRILHSDGVVLRLLIDVSDASGRTWLNRIYSGSANWAYYGDQPDYRTDPFQGLYNRIANDLSTVRATLGATELRQIIDISQLRYAAALSPAAFSEFLVRQDDGSMRLRRLPARNDPMIARIERLRKSEYLFIDTVDAQYGSFYRSMGPTYSLWRRYSFGQTLELEELRQTQGQGRGGFPAMKQAYDNYKEGKVQQQALKELSESFNTEVEPTVLELSGQMVQLNGSLQSQYSEWRRLLRAIYTEETGLPAENAAESAGSANP
jgi:hypothetical protein